MAGQRRGLIDVAKTLVVEEPYIVEAYFRGGLHGNPFGAGDVGLLVLKAFFGAFRGFVYVSGFDDDLGISKTRSSMLAGYPELNGPKSHA